MKQHSLSLIMITVLTATLFTSCKKSESKEEVDPKISQFCDDANRYKHQLEEADYNIIKALGKFSAFGTIMPFDTLLSNSNCIPNVDSSMLLQKTLTFNFDGSSNCIRPYSQRSGQIKVQLTNGTYWNNVGAELTLIYTNFKIEFHGYNQSILFNGVRKLKNINGIDWTSFITGISTIKYSERGFNIGVKNEDNSTATWNTAGITELNYANETVNPDIAYDHVVFTANGDTALNGFNTVNSWGTNRYGYSFISYNNAPMVSNTSYGLYKFISGEIIQQVNNGDYTVDYGFNESGNRDSSALHLNSYKITWLKDGLPYSSLVSYK